MDVNIAPLLVTGGFTLTAALASSALTLIAANRRDKRQSFEASYFRNLEHRRTLIVDFLLVYDQLRRKLLGGPAAPGEHDDLDELRRRLGEGRTTLELFCRPETRPVLAEAERLGRRAWLGAIGREPFRDDEFAGHGEAMERFKETMLAAFRKDLGEQS
ncbi:hypothetical protein GCM10010168_20480 [Actinoplanes ianthinogenes]|uniref:SMODS and SLOG-associating 2TM effector domain-containing protein n=1 Tax=Actinoplanes ianthinogenes TaxID=122358 RepID=A0ABM7M7Q2_9ACTN|nr:hypothetical protein [Actinoplanes ianthinogenes]BCJ47689.1 hypothetical protein Aiant_83460 [Actinoplanes ianthinogenes]GGR03489.1 hypothetical protein GCM10010168_20480 [Actinoplanes ianthinogenes]